MGRKTTINPITFLSEFAEQVPPAVEPTEEAAAETDEANETEGDLEG